MMHCEKQQHIPTEMCNVRYSVQEVDWYLHLSFHPAILAAPGRHEDWRYMG